MSAVTINIDTSLTNIPTINIGKQGENEATQVVFDVSEMISTYGSGTAVVVVQRRGDLSPYELDNTTQSGDTVTWLVSDVDTAIYGTGRVQLFWTIDEEIAKTVTYAFFVEEALTDPTDAPVTEHGWISQEIGDLDSLTTTAKTDLVSAINEVDSHADTNATNIATNTSAIGTLANLTTTEQGSLVGAINEVDADLTDVKEDLEYLRVNSAVPFPMTIELYGIAEASGADNTNSNFIRTNGYLLLDGICKLVKKSNSVAYIFTYDLNGTKTDVKYLNSSYLEYEFEASSSYKYRISYAHYPAETIGLECATEFAVFQLSDMFVKNDDLTATSEDIRAGEITGEVALSESDFTVGSLEAGVLKTNVKYRVASESMETASYDITISPRTGFKFSAHLFSSGVYQENSGWISTLYKIPKGQQYKLLIARTTENTGETANVAEFVSGIYIRSLANNLTGNFVNALTSGFRFIYHFGMENVTYRGANPPLIPSQSIYDVRNCANLGFKCIEANVHKTLDGAYVVTHGVGGALGHDFDDLNGNDAGEMNVVISETTLSDLQSNYRYRSSNPDYRVPITTLQEFLAECSRLNIKVMMMYKDATSLQLAINIMGRDRIWLYNAPRNEYDGPITNYRSYTTKAAILADCDSFGVPYIYSMANPTDFTTSQLKDIAQTLHSKGYQLMTAYKSDETMNDLASYGWDYFILGNNTFREPVIINGKQINFEEDGTVTWTTATI